MVLRLIIERAEELVTWPAGPARKRLCGVGCTWARHPCNHNLAESKMIPKGIILSRLKVFDLPSISNTTSAIECRNSSPRLLGRLEVHATAQPGEIKKNVG